MSESTAIRANRKLIEKIDEYARRIERETGVAVKRQNAAQALIVLGLRVVNVRRGAK